MSFVLALDQGTTSSRAIVFDHAGTVRAVAQQEFRQIFPQPGWVEHDAAEIWATQSGVMHEALAKAGIGARDVAAIGITNQRETTVLWDRATGRPIANAIVWQDRRTAPLCDALRAAGHAAMIARKTGLVLDAYFSGTKLEWLLDHVPGARARARARRARLRHHRQLARLEADRRRRARHRPVERLPHAALRHPHAATGTTSCSRCFDVPRAVLPRVVPSSRRLRRTRSVGGIDVPIAGIAGDQQAALFGQACHAPGLAKNTYGTGCFLLLNTGTRRRRVAPTAC